MQLVTSQHSLLSEFYLNHRAWVYGWLCKKTGSTVDAADLTQDTFVKLFNQDDLATIQEPRGYLTTIAHSLMVNHFRRKDLERAYLQSLADLPQSVSLSLEERAIIFETLIELDAMLHGLSKPVREAYLMIQLDGLSYAEVAKHLNVTTRTIGNYIAKATLHCALFEQQMMQK